MRDELYQRKIITAAEREANKAFRKPEVPSKVTEDERARRAFHDNRERLKAERLARDKDVTRSTT